MTGSSIESGVCVITGAANGLGRDLTLGLLADGRSIAALDIDGAGLAKLADDAADNPSSLTCLTVDVRDRGAVVDAIGKVAAAGPITALINNAGIISVGDIVDMPQDDWDDVIAVNVNGAFYVAQAVASHMVTQSASQTEVAFGGRIVNIGSITGKSPRWGRSSYCVSKAAISMLTKSLALELAPHGITVNTVSPGSAEGGVVWQNIERGLTTIERLVGGDASKYRLGVPLGRLATGADMLAAIRFLLSEGAGHITGDELRIDGGQGMF